MSGTRVGEYLTISLDPPFTTQRYMEAIDVAEQAGVEFLIIDSLTHAWTGVGGMLELQGQVANRSGNSYTAWREVTPLHNKLIDRIMQCPMHVALNLRTKTEYAIEENERGKKTPKKLGMAPVFRDGIEFECTIFFEIGQDHVATASKDRTGVFDGQYFTITPNTGRMVYEWLESGAPAGTVPPPVKQTAPEKRDETLPLAERVDQLLKAYCAGLDKDGKEAVASQIKEITGGIANYRNVTDEAVLLKIYDHFNGGTQA